MDVSVSQFEKTLQTRREVGKGTGKKDGGVREVRDRVWEPAGPSKIQLGNVQSPGRPTPKHSETRASASFS